MIMPGCVSTMESATILLPMAVRSKCLIPNPTLVVREAICTDMYMGHENSASHIDNKKPY